MKKFTGVGSVGINRDLSQHDLPDNAWTDAKNIRFIDGYAQQFPGYAEVLASPSYTPQHLVPCSVSSNRYWIYATASKTFAVTNSGGTAVHTDITHLTPRTGQVNLWTSTLLSGVPILNANDGRAPMAWDLNTAHKFVDLSNWQAGYSCKSIRAFKNFLIALGVNKSGTDYPFMVKWSHPADPGGLPSSWDQTDATKLAGEQDIADGYDKIIDGLPLRDSFMIYKENSIWRMDFVGGQYVFKFTKVMGKSGAMNLNCIGDIDGAHVVLTNDDVIIHDGNTSTSILDKAMRRWLFQNIDPTNYAKSFVFVNPQYNEVYICFPKAGSTVCDTSIVYNYLDKTVSTRDLPNANHVNCGPVDSTLTDSTWAGDSSAWDSDLTLWDQDGYMVSALRCLVASADTKLYLLDYVNSYGGALPSSYVERVGLSLGVPEQIKLVKSIRPRIKGISGQTINIQVGFQNDPYDGPTWGPTMTHTIGQTVSNDCTVSGRYIAIRFSNNSAYAWRLESFDMDVVTAGYW